MNQINMKFAVVANPNKFEVKKVLKETIDWAGDNSVSLLISEETCTLTGLYNPDVIQKMNSDNDAIDECDVVIVIGGDGTILYTARISSHSSKPILGVNGGRLGFMTDTRFEDLNEALKKVKSGNYTIDKRHFLKAVDTIGNEYYALNEFLFARKDSTAMINITAEYDGSLINTYWADGLIVASSTGSTAYNLSSGGPIVVPGSGVMLVTPINPHTLTTRPLVVRSDKPLKIRVEEQESDVSFSYDGVHCNVDILPLEVEIIASDLAFNLIRLPGQDYFETLRNKLMWGKDSRRN
jgi:NAD+ kinase|tara:strand:- start:193620 stop:194504 length:885 start_codon:yes stop_codon:yes gene_type:complete